MLNSGEQLNIIISIIDFFFEIYHIIDIFSM